MNRTDARAALDRLVDTLDPRGKHAVDLSTVSPADVARLDRAVMMNEYLVRLLPAAFWTALDPLVRFAWCCKRARYGIVTTELVEWLHDRIAGRRAIEIGAGAGDLGYYLGIPSTDSFAQQDNPHYRGWFALTGQAATMPGPHVRKFDALKAVEAMKPEVVVASWVTHRQSGAEDGSAWGVRETAIVRLAEYIHVGNTNAHAGKFIHGLPHTTFRLPWMVSRSIRPDTDRVWIWKRQG